ncbi:MAG: STAS domain-containing protein [Bacteroidia bacterium]|nr:STAS domain-containing protein [Bacteroidia bacterium]MDW8302128.1 STAS domain-containing protein [Bacteroidia bacterium]
MNIKTTVDDNVVIIKPIGEVDAYSSIDLDNAVAYVVKNYEQPLIVLDGSELTYISSAGIGVFITYLEPIRRKKGEMIFANLRREVLYVFTVLGLDKLVIITETVSQAKERLNHVKESI